MHINAHKCGPWEKKRIEYSVQQKTNIYVLLQSVSLTSPHLTCHTIFMVTGLQLSPLLQLCQAFMDGIIYSKPNFVVFNSHSCEYVLLYRFLHQVVFDVLGLLCVKPTETQVRPWSSSTALQNLDSRKYDPLHHSCSTTQFSLTSLILVAWVWRFWIFI